MRNNPKILTVWLGNICRSPMAEGILREKLENRKITVIVDYAGTGGCHTGENPDPWYGNTDGCEKVYHLLNEVCEQVIKSHFK